MDKILTVEIHKPVMGHMEIDCKSPREACKTARELLEKVKDDAVIVIRNKTTNTTIKIKKA